MILFTFPHELTETQLQFISNIVSLILGFLSSVGLQWYSKRKPKNEVKEEHTDFMNKAAKDNIEQAQAVNLMLEKLLNKEREHFEEQIEAARTACHEQIENLKQNLTEEYTDIINKMRVENANIVNDLTMRVTELKTRLAKYETDITTGKYKAITPADEVNHRKQMEKEKAKIIENVAQRIDKGYQQGVEAVNNNTPKQPPETSG